MLHVNGCVTDKIFKDQTTLALCDDSVSFVNSIVMYVHRSYITITYFHTEMSTLLPRSHKRQKQVI